MSISEKDYLKVIDELNYFKEKVSFLESFLTTRDKLEVDKHFNNDKKIKIYDDMYNQYLKNNFYWLNVKDDIIDGEEWVPVNEYEGYFISNLGRVKSTLHRYGNYKRFLIQQKNKDGYLRVSFSRNRKNKCFFVHRLVAKHFIKNEENKTDVNHIDGLKENNSVFNLEWNTKSENIKHSINYGLRIMGKGQNHNLSKLTDSDVIYIKQSLLKKVSQYYLADKYKVTQSCISNIKRGVTWSHL
jgi:hypothetical protein